MSFLFSHDTIRPSQRALAEAVWDVCNKKGELMAHAPTGLGKTAAAVCPAVSYALKERKVVLFLTSRHTQHAIVLATLKKLKELHNLPLQVSDFVAKKWMCAKEESTQFTSNEFMRYCKKLREKDECDFYTNTRQKQQLTVDAKLALSYLKTSLNDVHQIKDHAIGAHLCPYELAIEQAKSATIIIADYNYAFHPQIQKNFLRKIDKTLADTIIIVDEAHNLASRIKESTSLKLTPLMVQSAMQECMEVGAQELFGDLQVLKELFEETQTNYTQERLMTKEWLTDVWMARTPMETLLERLSAASQKIYALKDRSFLGSLAEFLQAWNQEEQGYTRILRREEKGISINYRCLDPSVHTQAVLEHAHATIFMSGTLTPIAFYHDILGLSENANVRLFERSFDKAKALHLVVPLTTTKYNQRSITQYDDIAKHCAQMLGATPGNAAIFFPSYDILRSVQLTLSRLSPKRLFLETSKLNHTQRAHMLEQFRQTPNAALCAVSAGSFGEGIDLPGILKCVIIVGIALPKPDLETQQLIAYYDQRYQKGWEYGYIYPALNKTFQNAGRCIRTETDSGIIVYLDQRFSQAPYINLFPRDVQLKVSQNYLPEMKQFFEHNGS